MYAKHKAAVVLLSMVIGFLIGAVVMKIQCDAEKEFLVNEVNKEILIRSQVSLIMTTMDAAKFEADQKLRNR